MCIHILSEYAIGKRRCREHEDDLSAKDQTESEGSRLQSQNEQRRRQKGISCQKSKRKSKINSLMIA